MAVSFREGKAATMTKLKTSTLQSGGPRLQLLTVRPWTLQCSLFFVEAKLGRVTVSAVLLLISHTHYHGKICIFLPTWMVDLYGTWWYMYIYIYQSHASYGTCWGVSSSIYFHDDIFLSVWPKNLPCFKHEESMLELPSCKTHDSCQIKSLWWRTRSPESQRFLADMLIILRLVPYVDYQKLDAQILICSPKQLDRVLKGSRIVFQLPTIHLFRRYVSFQVYVRSMECLTCSATPSW